MKDVVLSGTIRAESGVSTIYGPMCACGWSMGTVRDGVNVVTGEDAYDVLINGKRMEIYSHRISGGYTVRVRSKTKEQQLCRL